MIKMLCQPDKVAEEACKLLLVSLSGFCSLSTESLHRFESLLFVQYLHVCWWDRCKSPRSNAPRHQLGTLCGFLPTLHFSFFLETDKRTDGHPKQQKMKSVSGLLLALVAVSRYTTAVPSVSQGYDASRSINIATVVSTSDVQEQANSSSALGEHFVDRLDLMLVGNDSISSTWLDAVAGFAVAADSKVLYQTARWSLIEDGTQQDKLSSFWARFQSVNSTATSMSICAMVVEWDSSWKENKAALSAVEVEDRLTDKCAENDTIAVAFTSAVSKTAAGYFKGKIAVNDAVAPFKMQDVDSSMVPEASDRLFVHLAEGLCPRDESAIGLSSENDAKAPLISLFRGEVCVPSYGPKNPQTPNASLDSDGYTDSDSDSDWKRDLRFIIPIGVCVFLVGCAGLIYLLRQKKKNSATTETETSKEEEKDDPSSLPYVLTIHPV